MDDAVHVTVVRSDIASETRLGLSGCNVGVIRRANARVATAVVILRPASDAAHIRLRCKSL
jgi:hypothetical protein